ncbi:MAG: hypothetical protein WC346_04475 [Methanogenium sp.]|jgi:hypothetical protein
MKSNNKLQDNKEQRAKEFLECLGNGKTIYQCESEDEGDEYE